MSIYNATYATSEQVVELENLANDGHAEALAAFGADCIHEYRKSVVKSCLIGCGIAAVFAGITKIATTVSKRNKAKRYNEALEKIKEEYTLTKKEES